MPNSRKRNKGIYFPLQRCDHRNCPYNPECPSEIIESLLTNLSPKLKAAVDFLRKNHHSQEFTITELEQEFNVSLRCFEQMFTQELGCTPKQCLDQLRISHFRQLTQNKNFLSIKEAMHKSGFRTRSNCYYALHKHPTSKSL